MKHTAYFLLAMMAMLLTTACSDDNDNEANVNPTDIQKQWIRDYAQAGTVDGTDMTYDRVVEVYEF